MKIKQELDFYVFQAKLSLCDGMNKVLLITAILVIGLLVFIWVEPEYKKMSLRNELVSLTSNMIDDAAKIDRLAQQYNLNTTRLDCENFYTQYETSNQQLLNDYEQFGLKYAQLAEITDGDSYACNAGLAKYNSAISDFNTQTTSMLEKIKSNELCKYSLQERLVKFKELGIGTAVFTKLADEVDLGLHSCPNAWAYLRNGI